MGRILSASRRGCLQMGWLEQQASLKMKVFWGAEKCREAELGTWPPSSRAIPSRGTCLTRSLSWFKPGVGKQWPVSQIWPIACFYK